MRYNEFIKKPNLLIRSGTLIFLLFLLFIFYSLSNINSSKYRKEKIFILGDAPTSSYFKGILSGKEVPDSSVKIYFFLENGSCIDSNVKIEILDNLFSGSYLVGINVTTPDIVLKPYSKCSIMWKEENNMLHDIIKKH